MLTRPFGQTGLNVSVLTFGCGAVGGLMTKGAAADQDRAVAWARDNGINHFDTAALYGNGASEENLGRALGTNRDGIIVSTKVRLAANDLTDPATAIRTSLETSLRRLRQDHVDIFQLHNTIGAETCDDTLSADFVLSEILPAFETLRDAGKARFIGFTANGDTDALHAVTTSGRLHAAQIFYNLLVPSAGEAMPQGYPAQDYRKLLNVAHDNGVGAIGVRVLAGGALSGRTERHPLGMPIVAPIGSNTDYETDVARGLQFMPLIEAGFVETLPELAIRFAVSNMLLPTTEIGIATLEELQKAAHAINKGPLPKDALDQIRNIQSGLA